MAWVWRTILVAGRQAATCNGLCLPTVQNDRVVLDNAGAVVGWAGAVIGAPLCSIGFCNEKEKLTDELGGRGTNERAAGLHPCTHDSWKASCACGMCVGGGAVYRYDSGNEHICLSCFRAVDVVTFGPVVISCRQFRSREVPSRYQGYGCRGGEEP
ncbi:hypothetical protein B0T19DRAFT_285431 [Cercophora scortea]|uniref:Secreted protein n=1 Tax=Cercophora scortea TaxID=314031 RepID=A0AAE0M719_9PEZI|nr:hypothetical protein B0T19DRAFT_285431 [Cercophora scortea]